MSAAMRASIGRRPEWHELFVATAVAILISLMTVGAIITLLMTAADDALSVVKGIEVMAVGALLGVIGGPIKYPIAIMAAALFFLVVGRLLINSDLKIRAYSWILWAFAGAILGAVVQIIMNVQLAVELGTFGFEVGDLLLYGPPAVSGVAGMLSWRAVIFVLTNRGL
jgi:hypothetical protein